MHGAATVGDADHLIGLDPRPYACDPQAVVTDIEGVHGLGKNLSLFVRAKEALEPESIFSAQCAYP